MMQALLEDRLKLKIRRETRDVPGYVLTVAEGGAKMQPYQGDCTPTFGVPQPGRKRCWEIGEDARKEATFTPHFAPDSVVRDLDEFALWLYAITDRPVLNKTGITGRYFLDVVFAPDQSTPGALTRLTMLARARNGGDIEKPSNPPGPSIATALQQQLGLKLEPATASRDFLIVDNAERPSSN